jgi:hypothetical protein
VKLTIGDLIPAVASDSYMVEVRAMGGDADYYRDFAIGPFKRGEHEENLQSLLETLDRMKEKFGNSGMSWYENYNDVLGYYEWFHGIHTLEVLIERHGDALVARDGEEIHQKIMDLSKGHSSRWHGDAMVDCESPEQLDKFIVFYYDEAGFKHEVRVDRED